MRYRPQSGFDPLEQTLMTEKPESKGAAWQDVIRWFWDVFGPSIKAAIGPAVFSGVVVAVAGWEFVKSSHVVPGWVIVIAAGITGLCLVSVGLHFSRWRLKQRGGALVMEHSGPRVLTWDFGRRGDTPIMMVWGDFQIANRAPGNVVVPRSIMVVSYKRWGFLPARRRVEGFGVFEPLAGHRVREERLHWEIEPPIVNEGDPLIAKVCLVDHLGNENWTRWLRWRYSG
jgi:hypothetical protein